MLLLHKRTNKWFVFAAILILPLPPSLFLSLLGRKPKHTRYFEYGPYKRAKSQWINQHIFFMDWNLANEMKDLKFGLAIPIM